MPFCQFENCEAYTEGNTNYCGTHNSYLRKLAKEITKPPKIHKPIRQVSVKMAKELVIFEAKKAEHLKKHPDCQIKLVGCMNDRRTNTVHHAAKRGKNLNNEETFLTGCLYCHDQVETKLSAGERREKGLLL